MPTNHLGRVLTILMVLGIALIAIFPKAVAEPKTFFDPSVPFGQKHNLKPGIDMVGGTSLLYEIKVADGGKVSSDLSTEVMNALKKRVDPEGVRNLVWRPQGATQLEIQLPLSNRGGSNVGQIRSEFAAAQKAVEATNVRLGLVLDAIERLSGDERAQRLAKLAGDSAVRREIFTELAQAYDDRKAANARRDAGAEGAALAKIEQLKAKIEPTNVNVAELDQALEAIEQAKAKQARDASAPPPPADAIELVDGAKTRAKEFPSQLAAIEQYIKAHEAYGKIKDQLDEAADLKRLLQGSGVLEYHILVDQNDPRVPEFIGRLEQGLGTAPRAGDTAKWGLVDKPEQFRANGVIRRYAGREWVLLDLRPEKSLTQTTGNQWALRSATPQRDPQTGEVHVAFQLDAQGGVYMGQLTGSNLQKPMAIVLDDKVISAPTIQSRINDSGQITGRYTKAEINYLVNTLNAGSLPARLAEEPISERTVGPQLGADNLKSGLLSCVAGLVVVGIFLIGYYYLSGVVAFFAVCLNLVLILGALAALNATFTLPGVAALVLTLGTAVDANVLVFERLREEQLRGFPLKTALRNAYDRAFSAIFDSNVVTAITSLVLYVLGSEEVKGFGLTLLIGIVASLFTSLFVTKTVFAILVDKFGVKRLGSVPMSIPTWDRLLKPNIDWMGKAWLFCGASLALVVVGMGLFVHYIGRGEMFDIEFSSGTSVTVDFKQPLTIEQVRQRLAAAENREVLVGGAADKSAATQPAVATTAGDRRIKVGNAIPSPAVVAVGTDGQSYEIVTPNVDVAAVRTAIFDVYQDVLKINVPSTFARVGSPIGQALGSAVYAAESAAPVGPDGKPRFIPENYGEFRGGVAIYLDGLNPPIAPKVLEERLTQQRLQPGSQSKGLPNVTVVSPAGTAGAGGGDQPASELLILAVDNKVLADEDRDKWQAELAEPLWKLVNDAVATPPSLAKVSNFNAQVAGATQNDALVALTLAIIIIMGYVWLRFGEIKYGWANTVALLHDTFFIIGALGVAHFLYAYAKPLADALLIEPFRLNLTVVAGILTIMGYSMVDTIVVFDRIRELRGQRGQLTRKVVNDALNQTLSRTLLTAGTTVATLFVMYIFGGPGIHGFTYVLLVGILVGTYSSIAIAAPVLMLGMKSADATGSQPDRREGVKPGSLQKA